MILGLYTTFRHGNNVNWSLEQVKFIQVPLLLYDSVSHTTVTRICNLYLLYLLNGGNETLDCAAHKFRFINVFKILIKSE